MRLMTLVIGLVFCVAVIGLAACGDGGGGGGAVEKGDVLTQPTPGALVLRPVADLTGGYGSRLAVAPDGRTWASAKFSQLVVWEEEKPVSSVGSPQGDLRSLAFSDDGTRLYAGAHVFDLAARRFLDLPPLAPALVQGLGQSMYSVADSFEVTASAWTEDGSALVVATGYRPSRHGADSYDGPGSRLLVLGPNRTLLQDLTAQAPNTTSYIRVCGTHIAAVTDGLLIFELPAFAKKSIERPVMAISDLAFFPGCGRLARVGFDRKLVVWDIATGSASVTVEHPEPVQAVAVHPSLDVVATGSRDGKVRLWRLGGSAPALVAEAYLGEPVEALVFGPRGDRLLAAGYLRHERMVIFSLLPR